MIALDVKIRKEDIKVSSAIKQSFHHPIVFYLLNKDSFYLCSFVILDFQNEEIKYVETFSETNVELIKNEYGAAILKDPPHSVMTITKNKFINMIYPIISKVNNTVRIVDLEKGKMEIYSPTDFGHDHLGRVNETATRDPDDPNSFYICFTRKDEQSTEYYKFSSDLLKNEFLFDDQGIFKKSPHQIARCKNYILSTGFGEEEGKILVYDIRSKDISIISTIAKTSHLEISGNIVYYASNNIKIEGAQVKFMGPARIGKLKVEENEIVQQGEFWNESGFRFTSHKILNPDVLVTFGFPNRMFFIDSTSMEMMFYYDIDKQIIPDIDQLHFLNEEYPQTLTDPFRYTALEVSDDGKYIIFFNQTHIRFFNYYSRRIEFEIPYKISKNHFQLSHHCDFLR